MSTVGKYWRLGKELFRANLASAMEYRISFINQVVFMVLNDIFLLFFWWVLFTRFGDINGWQRDDVFLMYGLSAASFGFGMTFFGNAMRLARLVADGQLDSYLTLPKDPLLHLLMSRSMISAMGDYLFGLVVCLVVAPSWGTLAIFLTTTACGGLIFIAFCVLAHSLAFFIGDSQGLSANLVELLLNFSLYPESIFSEVVRVLTYIAVPAAYVSYLPVSLIRAFNPWILLWILAATVTFILAAYVAFRAGLRRYESGNLFGARM